MKECSLDNSRGKHKYLVDFEVDKKVVNFDEMKRLFCKEYLGIEETSMKSVDCYLELKTGEILLIEFKNGELKKESEKVKLKLKLKDSMLIICDAFEKSIRDVKDRLIYIVVYNGEKNPQKNKKIKQHVYKQSSKKNRCRFKLGDLDGNIVKKIMTLDEYEFKEYWKKNCEKKLLEVRNYSY